MHKILIVDDERDLRETSAELLRLEGYEVVTAADGDEAVMKSGANNFDLALVDLVLPGQMNGLEIISKLRTRSPQTHIIAFTGFSGQNFSQKAIKAGANEFVTKPGLAKNLVTNINKFFNKESAIVNIQPEDESKPQNGSSVQSRPVPHNGTNGSNGTNGTNGHARPESAPRPVVQEQQIVAFTPFVFSNMPDQHVRGILDLGTGKTVQVRENYILDATKEMVIVKSGSLSCWYRNSLIGYFKAGESIGESSVFISGKTNFMLLLKSEESFDLIVINKSDLAKYFQNNKNLAMRYAANVILCMSKKFMLTCERVARMNEEVRQLKTPVDGVMY